MNFRQLAGALALGLAAVPSPVLADDPKDPAMRDASARARDAAIIKRLNEEQLKYVRERDARYAEGWRAYRDAPRENARRQAEHEREMAAWRHAVKMCQNGRHEYCAN